MAAPGQLSAPLPHYCRCQCVRILAVSSADKARQKQDVQVVDLPVGRRRVDDYSSTSTVLREWLSATPAAITMGVYKWSLCHHIGLAQPAQVWQKHQLGTAHFLRLGADETAILLQTANLQHHQIRHHKPQKHQ